MSRLKRRAAVDVPEALCVYDPARYRAEALAEYRDWTSDGPDDFYYRALVDAGVAEELAIVLRSTAALCEMKADIEPDNPEWRLPRQMYPFGGSMFGRLVS